MNENDEPKRRVVSTAGGYLTAVLAVGLPTLMLLVVFVLYLVAPEKVGPSAERPGANTFSEMLIIVPIAIVLTIAVVRGFYAHVAISAEAIEVARYRQPPRVVPRAALRSLGSLPVSRWYLVWLTFVPGHGLRRVFSFAYSPHPIPLDPTEGAPHARSAKQHQDHG